MMLLSLIWIGISCGGGRKDAEKVPSRVSIIKGFEEGDSTYSIADGISGEFIYHAGHNPLELDTVIQKNHIFIERLITEEWSDRIIVCNPDDSLLMVAYLMAWDMAHLDRGERERLYKETRDWLFHTEYLDLEKRKIGIRLFNDKVITLDLHGEQHGNYYVEWSLEESKVVADTVRISEDEELIVMNNELRLYVRYKGEPLFDRDISSDNFKGIDRPEQYILAEPRSLHSDNDMLVISGSMTMFDTDCGYDIEILISPDGQMKLRHIETDSFLTFSDMIEDIRNDYEGESLCDLVFGMDFYKEAESSAQEYAALYAFYLYNSYEYAWEGVGGYIYEMLIQYPSKFDELHMTLTYLSDDQREKILDRLIYSLIFECKASADASSQPSFEHFASMFPYLDTPQVEKFFDSVNPY